MSNEDIKTKVREVICESAQMNIESIGDGDNLHTDLGIDSLTLLEIALRVDQEFGTDFPEEELMKMSSVEKAAELVEQRLAAIA